MRPDPEPGPEPGTGPRTSPPAAPLVRARGLRFAYGDLPVLEGLDLDLAPGELVFVLGPNGSGKSTLLNLLAGALVPDRGEVHLGDAPLAGLDPRARARRVALVPQSLDGVGDVVVGRFVAGGRYAHRAAFAGLDDGDRRAVHEALERTDVADLAARRLGELSGGQRQRVLVARALAQGAPAVLMDEPTASLDPEHQVGVLEVAARLSCEGAGVLVVTHDLNLTSQYATRVLLLDDGRVVASGTPREVLTPGVLGPVYGPRLWFGQLEDGRPVVLPRRDVGALEPPRADGPPR